MLWFRSGTKTRAKAGKIHSFRAGGDSPPVQLDLHLGTASCKRINRTAGCDVAAAIGCEYWGGNQFQWGIENNERPCPPKSHAFAGLRAGFDLANPCDLSRKIENGSVTL
jgi:hypothetical protein